jgi:hypothetical protein
LYRFDRAALLGKHGLFVSADEVIKMPFTAFSSHLKCSAANFAIEVSENFKHNPAKTLCRFPTELPADDSQQTF